MLQTMKNVTSADFGNCFDVERPVSRKFIIGRPFVLLREMVGAGPAKGVSASQPFPDLSFQLVIPVPLNGNIVDPLFRGSAASYQQDGLNDSMVGVT